MGEGKEGRGLGNMGSSNPRGAALQVGAHPPPAGRELGTGREGTIEAAHRELSETHSGCCREPWRRNLLVPLVLLEGERRERIC